MISGLERVMAHRIWFVPDLMVWGLPSVDEVEFVATEQAGSSAQVMFGVADIGDGPQQVQFGQLVDHRGNRLPDSIRSPRVMLRPRSGAHTFVAEPESPTGFKIARDSSASDSIPVDLLIIEMGE
jgi:hypothetical protein